VRGRGPGQIPRGSAVRRQGAATVATALAQEIPVTGTQRDVVELLTADHRDFERIFQQLENLRGATDEQSVRRKRELVDEVTIGLVKHSVAEETQVYPEVEKKIDKGEAEHSKH
jgi:hemerythrin superfamily protein